ncbi:MAG TPA: ABC transporter ATP-binding protein [Candidatus Dormibacteraeota bacterium]
MIAAGFTVVVLAVLDTALPAVLGRAVDSIFGNAPAAWVFAAAGMVAGLAAMDAADDLAVGFATARSTAWLRRELLRHFVRLGVSAPERYPPGDLASRMVGNATQAGRAAVDIVRAVANLLPALGAIVALGLIDPWLCLVVGAGMPLLVVLLRAFVRDASGLAARYLEVQGAIAARLAGAIAGARTIAASGTIHRETDRVLAELPQLHHEGLGLWRAQARIMTQQGLLVPLLEVAVLALAGVELARGHITPGALLAAAQYAILATSLTSVLPSLTRLVRARAGAARAWEVMREPTVAHGAGAAPRGDGRIEFRGVTVRAGDRALLDHVDLVIPGGALTAIVGRSGSGKSVLTGLAGRLADPDEGQVLLDGTALRELGHDTLRELIGYAFERPALFGDTIGDAIAFGVSTPSPGAVAQAARRADADGFVERLPQGCANPLAATPLSGGEAQRLGLARAFAHPARVLILDDVAASLDTVTDFRITSVLTTALAGRTRIVVAHRVSTASRADMVVWLHEGRVRAVAPHPELWRDAGYRAIFEPARLAPHPNGHRRGARTAA